MTSETKDKIDLLTNKLNKLENIINEMKDECGEAVIKRIKKGPNWEIDNAKADVLYKYIEKLKSI